MRTNYFSRAGIQKGLMFVLAIALLGSCVNYRKVSLIQQTEDDAALINIDNPRETSYRIQTGDQLYIKIHSLDPQTSRFFQTEFPNLMNPTYLYLNSYNVDEEGFVSFSFIEKMHVQGSTIEETQKKLQEVLNEYFNEINVVVKLVNFQVTLLGEIQSPGTYTVQREYFNLLQAISLGGGVTEFGDINKVKLIRQTPTGSEVKIIDLSQMDLLSKDYYHVMPNDVIYIDSRPVKSFTQRAVPYSLFISLFSTALVVYSLLTN